MLRNLAYAGYHSDPTEDEILEAFMEEDAPPSGASWLTILFLAVIVAVLSAVLAAVLLYLARPALFLKGQAYLTAAAQEFSGLSRAQLSREGRKIPAAVTGILRLSAPVKPAAPAPASAAVMSDSVLSEKLTALAAASGQTAANIGSMAVLVNKSRAYGLDPVLIAALAGMESGFDPARQSSSGKIGLLQLDRERGGYIAGLTGVPWRGAEALSELEYNLEIGLGYLKFLDGLFKGDLRSILLAKQLGPRRFIDAASRGEVMPVEALAFVDQVAFWRARWQTELQSRSSGKAP